MKKVFGYVLVFGILIVVIAALQKNNINISQLDKLNEKSSIEFSDTAKGQISEAINGIDDLGNSVDELFEETGEKIKQYGEDASNRMEEAFVNSAQEAAGKTARNLWQKMKETLSDIIK